MASFQQKRAILIFNQLKEHTEFDFYFNFFLFLWIATTKIVNKSCYENKWKTAFS